MFYLNKCVTCGKKKLQTKKYRNCSYKCRSLNMRMEKHPHWKGGRYINKFGYVLIYIPNHKRAYSNGYVFEHIIVAEKKINRNLISNECVHHINGIKNDNRPENLEVMTKFEHKSHHMKERHIFTLPIITKRNEFGQVIKGGCVWTQR